MVIETAQGNLDRLQSVGTKTGQHWLTNVIVDGANLLSGSAGQTYILPSDTTGTNSSLVCLARPVDDSPVPKQPDAPRESLAIGKAAAFQLNTGETHAFDGFASDVRTRLQKWVGRDLTSWSTTQASPASQQSKGPASTLSNQTCLQAPLHHSFRMNLQGHTVVKCSDDSSGRIRNHSPVALRCVDQYGRSNCAQNFKQATPLRQLLMNEQTLEAAECPLCLPLLSLPSISCVPRLL